MEHESKGKTKTLEGPGAGYNGQNAPTSTELGAPTKVYPGSDKLGHDRPKGTIEGPCDEAKGGYHR